MSLSQHEVVNLIIGIAFFAIGMLMIISIDSINCSLLQLPIGIGCSISGAVMCIRVVGFAWSLLVVAALIILYFVCVRLKRWISRRFRPW
jgi:hypothetical protein